MTKKTFWPRALLILLFLGIIITACDTGSGSSTGNDASEVIGTWVGNLGGNSVRVIVDSSSWTFILFGIVYDSGTYVFDGVRANLYREPLKTNISWLSLIFFVNNYFKMACST